MEDILEKFKFQLQFSPEIENSKKFKTKDKFLIIGMGGSHLAADLLKISHPKLDLLIYSDFNLPQVSDLNKRNIILISYSGNTLEVIKNLEEIKKRNIIPLIISAKGYLLSQAKLLNYPYIELPEKNLPPRLALGYFYLSLLKIIGDNQSLKKINKIKFNLLKIKNKAFKLSLRLKGKIPIIYSSYKNYPLAYNFKIRFNENSKIPAFCNYLPEINHNEIEGFSNFRFNNFFYFLLIKDDKDSKEIKKNFKILENLFKKRKFLIDSLILKGNNIFEKIFSSIHLADWLTWYLAKIYKVNPIFTKYIEEIKKQMKN